MTTREENGMEGTVVQSKRSDIEIIANLLAIVLAFVEVVLVSAGHNVMKGRTFVPLWEILAFGIPALAFVVLFDILTYILRYRYDHDHREMILFADRLIIRNRSGVPQLIPTERITKIQVSLWGSLSIWVNGWEYKSPVLDNAAELEHAIRQSIEMQQNAVMAEMRSASDDLFIGRKLVEMGVLTEHDIELLQANFAGSSSL